MNRFVRPARRIVLLSAALGLAATAQAGVWIDKYGRTTTLKAPGVTDAVLQPVSRTPEQAADLFKTLCVDTGLDRAAAGRAAEAIGFRYAAQSMPFNDPVDIGSWLTTDAELTVARDMFFNKSPQCSVQVALAGTPDRAAVIAALSALLGQPANVAKALKKDGAPDKRWQPEWTVDGAATGLERRIFLYVLPSNRVQIAALERKGAK